MRNYIINHYNYKREYTDRNFWFVQAETMDEAMNKILETKKLFTGKTKPAKEEAFRKECHILEIRLDEVTKIHSERNFTGIPWTEARL